MSMKLILLAAGAVGGWLLHREAPDLSVSEIRRVLGKVKGLVMSTEDRLIAIVTKLETFSTDAQASFANISTDIQNLKDQVAAGQATETTLARLESIGNQVDTFKQALADLAAATPDVAGPGGGGDPDPDPTGGPGGGGDPDPEPTGAPTGGQ
jgi:hypothetical protein